MQTGKFQLSYRHLSLIGEKFFSNSPVIALRELIQNAHDAVLMRASQTPQSSHSPTWGVKIDLDPTKRTISIADSGVGMNERDITETLTVLGASSKNEETLHELRKRDAKDEWLKNVVGTFGFGFVAGLAISDKIELWSRKQNGKNDVYCCFEKDKEDFSWEQGEFSQTPQVGTLVKLHVRGNCESIGDDDIQEFRGGSIVSKETVQHIIRKYCDLLQFGIWVNGEHTNDGYAPWEHESNPQPEDYLRFFKRRYGENVNDPITYISFHYKEDDKEDGTFIEATGVLYIPRMGLREQDAQSGALDIFVKRMWVCEGEIDILPPWARFLKGVIISPDLATTLDRSGLDKKNENYHKIRRALRERLYEHFLDMAATQQETYNAFLSSYSKYYKAGLIKEFMDANGKDLHPKFSFLLRTIPLMSYSQNAPAGKRQNLNQYLKLNYNEPIVAPGGRKREIFAVNRPISPERQLEFRNILADKSYSIYVPEDELDYVFLQIMSGVFESVLEKQDVEGQFLKNFIQIITGEERERWNLFEEFLKGLTRASKGVAEEISVTVGNVPRTELPIVLFWSPVKGTGDQMEIVDEKSLNSSLSSISTQYKRTIVINAKQQLMKELLEYKEGNKLEQLEQWMEDIIHQAHHLAVLDHIGGMDSKTIQDIVQVDTSNLINIIQLKKDNARMGTERDTLQMNLRDKEKQLEDNNKRLDGGQENKYPFKIPDIPETRECAVLVTDLVNSSYILTGLDYKERGILFKEYIDMLKHYAESNYEGFFDKFTGDGMLVLFGVKELKENNLDYRAEFCNKALLFARSIKALTDGFLSNARVKEMLKDLYPAGVSLNAFSNRIAISFGRVAFGKFGDTASAVGTPIVQAARICSEKEFFEKSKDGILMTSDFTVSAGIPPNNLVTIENYTPRGLWNNISVHSYKQ